MYLIHLILGDASRSANVIKMNNTLIHSVLRDVKQSAEERLSWCVYNRGVSVLIPRGFLSGHVRRCRAIKVLQVGN